jgi:DNA (cytosine-5)-methyltransferase 1
MTIINIVELFAGAGGSSTGLKQVDNVNVVVANEYDKAACKTYDHNNKKYTKLVPGDITKKEIKDEIVKLSIEKNVNVLVGGIPCQTFSSAGKRDPFDPRGQLYRDYFEIVDRVEPKVCVIENVKGVTSMIHFKDDIKKELKEQIKLDIKNLTKKVFYKKYQEYTFKVIDKWVEMFNERDYNVEWRVLRSSDYGAPQHRQRMILIASKLENNEIIFPEITHNDNGAGGKKKFVSVKDAIDDLKDIPENNEINHTFRLYDRKERLLNNNPSILTSTQKKILNTPYNKSYTGYGEANKKCHPDFPCSTVKENHGAVFIHYEKPRHMTVRELARLQTFPDNIIFPCSKGQAYKQIGNAIPCILAKVIAESVKKMFSLNEDKK